MRTRKIRTTAVRSVALGLLAVAAVVATATSGLGNSAVAAAAPAPVVAAAAVSAATPPQTIERRDPRYEIVYRDGNYAKGSVSVQYGVEWVHADVPCCTEQIPGQFRVRGYALIAKNHLVKKVSVDSMLLGTEQHPVTKGGGSGASVQGLNLITNETPWYTDLGTYQFHVKVTFSVLWNDGTVTKFVRTSPFTMSGQ